MATRAPAEGSCCWRVMRLSNEANDNLIFTRDYPIVMQRLRTSESKCALVHPIPLQQRRIALSPWIIFSEQSSFNRHYVVHQRRPPVDAIDVSTHYGRMCSAEPPKEPKTITRSWRTLRRSSKIEQAKMVKGYWRWEDGYSGGQVSLGTRPKSGPC